jgi:hypothetical protein
MPPRSATLETWHIPYLQEPTRVHQADRSLAFCVNAAPSKRFQGLGINKTLKQVRGSHTIARQQRPSVFCCPALS